VTVTRREWLDTWESYRRLEQTVGETIDQAPDDQPPPIRHRRDATTAAVERLFALHGFKPCPAVVQPPECPDEVEPG
jgi:hypothetical protein